MAAKKRVDPIKQREKRAKIAAAIGGVLFLGLAAIQAPKIMKMMHPKPVVPPPTRVAAPDGSVPAGTQTQTTPTGVSADGQLADTDVPLSNDGAQLVTFEVFDTKNPFRPQVTESADSSSGDTTSTTPDATETTPTATTEVTTTPSVTPPPPTVTTETPPSAIPSTPSTPSTPTTTTTTPVVPVRPTVSISVNGTVTKVSSGGTFPSGTPVFRLVSWTKGEASIGIVGGSYATGDQTLKLAVGKPVTLQNTSDGKQYKLVLLSTP